MIVADLPAEEIAHRLAKGGLRLRTGPVVSAVETDIASIAKAISLLYVHHTVEAADAFVDFRVQVAPPSGLRRLIRPQVYFHLDGARSSFNPLPYDQAFPMLEWGLNWCVTSHFHRFLIVHAGVVARDDRALILPAPPGSGKSTLCAALMLRGWRLLSDELALIDPVDKSICPIPRPVSLKNESIAIVQQWSADAVTSSAVHDTIKGTVAHLRPTKASVASSNPARPAFLVFPKYRAGSRAQMIAISKADAFMRLVDNAFNYDTHGRRGFDTLADLIEASACYEFSYASLDEATAAFAALE